LARSIHIEPKIVKRNVNSYVHVMNRADASTGRRDPGATRRRDPGATRRRILDAVVALHEEVGPANTTISAVAERAGVQRLTVYRHFPDMAALVGACSAQWRGEHPLPDAAEWAGEADPARRTRAALGALYAYYERGERMLERVLEDESRLAELAAVMTEYHGWHRELVASLATGWGVAGEAQRRLRALASHAANFSTWRSLRREGLSTAAAAELMADCVAAIAGAERVG
jgi:AcrR family transcriptional regulator